LGYYYLVLRPPDLFDRETEWNDLAQFATERGSGTRLALVRGRRRQGKSFLLRRLADATNGFYYQAVEEEQSQAIAGFGRALGDYLKIPGGRLALDSWDDALRALGDMPTDKRPRTVVLDEFPYLLSHSPELPSLLQRFIDSTKNGPNSLRLILCGSALSVMTTLLEGAQALRGRAAVDIVVRPFDYRTSADFWNIEDPTTALLVNAVVGGTPGYRDLLPAAPPQRPSDFAKWLAVGSLNPASALFREDDYLLTEERSLSDRQLYHSVVSAIAGGARSQGAIAQALEREQRSVQHPLRALENAGFVIATNDALRSRRPIYRIADPIVRFHHAITRRDLARFEDRRTADAWKDAQPRFKTHVLGPHFEEIAREFVFRFASAHTVGGPVADVAPAVVNDVKQRTQHEVDVVALGRDRKGSKPILALGEAKHTEAKRTLGDLTRLERIRSLVAAKDSSAETARLLLFSASGFETNLTRTAASRDDVDLIDIERIYRGE
jgi:AAA+ ATPase superfamily predicted ATPase